MRVGFLRKEETKTGGLLTTCFFGAENGTLNTVRFALYAFFPPAKRSKKNARTATQALRFGFRTIFSHKKAGGLLTACFFGAENGT